MGNTKGWIDQDSNGWVYSLDKSIKNQLLSNSTRDDMSKLKTKLPRIMYHALWWLSCKICKCLFCNTFSQGLLMHRGLLTFQWRHLALRNAEKLVSEKCKNIFACFHSVCRNTKWFKRPNYFLPSDGHLRYQTIDVFFTHGNSRQRWGVVLRLLLKSDILGLLKIGLNLTTWKGVRWWGIWVKPSPWYGIQDPQKKQHEIPFSMLWTSTFYMNCRILMLHELRL